MPLYYQTNPGTYSPAQDGFHDTASAPWSGTGLWEEAGATLSALDTLGPAGFTFQLLSNFDSQRGLPLDPPGFRTMSLSVFKTLQTGATNDATLKLYIVNDPTPDLWSNSNLPSTSNALLVASLPSSLTDSNLTYTFTLDMTVVRPVITHSQWRGRLALVLTCVGASTGYSVTLNSNEHATAATRPGLATTEFPFNTGINTTDILRPGRIRTCSRTGRLAFADEFVEDGYVRGLRVHQDSYDPEDRSDEQVLPTSEGVIHDEVP